MSRRRFGAVRKLPSGRWQVRYRHPTTARYQTAPGTFASKTEAGRWLSMWEADVLRGAWVDPAMGEVRFGDVADRWMATKVHLRSSTRTLYDWLLTKHILPPSATSRSVPSRRSTSRCGFSAPKTTAGVRTITVPQFIIDVLLHHLARWSAPGPDGLVFVMPEGTPLRRENFRKRVWLPTCRAAGLDGLRFHDLRHTGATLAAASSAPLRAVMHRLGHASAAAAIRYQHRVAGQDEAIADYLVLWAVSTPHPAEPIRR